MSPTPIEKPVPVDVDPNPTEIQFRGVRKRPLGHYDAELADKVARAAIKFLGSRAKTNFPFPPDLRRAAATVARIPSQSRTVDSSSPPRAPVMLEWVFVLTNLMLETLSTFFDQISSPKRPQFALVGMAMSFVAFLICTLELLYRARKERAIWRQCWFYDQSDKPLGSFADNFGFICAASQCFTSTIQYVFHRSHADNPIKVSFFPLMLALSFLYLQFTKRKQLQA